MKKINFKFDFKTLIKKQTYINIGYAFKNFYEKSKINIQDILEHLQESGKYFVIFGVSLIFLMSFIAIAVFFSAVKSSEEVLVPNVIGKDLPVALVEMQQKELYPKIQLRYSALPNEKGLILEQSPSAGSIVKAGRRINLTVSRGAILNKVEDYLGQNFDDVKMHLQTLFTSMPRPLVVLSDQPLYTYSNEPAGTVLEQEPLPGTNITDPVTLHLVVSRGPENQKATVPNLIGMTTNDLLLQMTRSKLTFDFSSRSIQPDETAGTVVSQLPEAGQSVNNYSRVTAIIAFPLTQSQTKIHGIYTFTLPVYPYPLAVELSAQTPDGNTFTVVKFQHLGGLLTIPYEFAPRTVLILSVLGKEVNRFIVQ